MTARRCGDDDDDEVCCIFIVVVRDSARTVPTGMSMPSVRWRVCDESNRLKTCRQYQNGCRVLV